MSTDTIDHVCPGSDPDAGPHRLASRRSSCVTCNRSAQSVTRRARARLAREHEDQYAELFDEELALELGRRATLAS